MDFASLNEWLIQINSKDTMIAENSSISIVCCLLLLVVLYSNKKFNSTSIGITVLCLSQCIGTVVMLKVVEIASVEALFNYFVWYASWIVLYTTCLALLLKFHRFFQLRLSDVSLAIVFFYIVDIWVQAIDFIDRATFDTGYFAAIYQISGLLISYLTIPVVALMVVREYFQYRRQLKSQEL